jgi:hypothetical protein
MYVVVQTLRVTKVQGGIKGTLPQATLALATKASSTAATAAPTTQFRLFGQFG